MHDAEGMELSGWFSDGAVVCISNEAVWDGWEVGVIHGMSVLKMAGLIRTMTGHICFRLIYKMSNGIKLIFHLSQSNKTFCTWQHGFILNYSKKVMINFNVFTVLTKGYVHTKRFLISKVWS